MTNIFYIFSSGFQSLIIGFNALIQNALWLDLGRMLLGFAVGIYYYVVLFGINILSSVFQLDIQKRKKKLQILIAEQVPVYIAEITPKNLRGGFTSSTEVKGVLIIRVWMKPTHCSHICSLSFVCS